MNNHILEDISIEQSYGEVLECIQEQSLEELKLESLEHALFTMEDIHSSTSADVIGLGMAADTVMGQDMNLFNDSSMEGIGNYIKNILGKIWQSIKNAVLRFFRSIAEMVSKLISGVEGMQKKTERLEKKIQEKQAKGAKPQEKIIKVMGGGRLHMGGMVNGEETIKGLGNINSVFNEFSSIYLDNSERLIKEIVDISRMIPKITNDDSNAKVFEDRVRALASYPAETSNLLRDELRGMRDREVPGGKRVSVEETKHDKDGIPSDMPKIKFEKFEKGIRYDERTEAEALSDVQMLELIQESRHGLRIIKETMERAESLGEMYDAAAEEKDRLYDRRDIREKLDEAMAGHSMNILLRFFRMGLPGSVSKMTGYHYGVIRSTLIYIDASLSNLK